MRGIESNTCVDYFDPLTPTLPEGEGEKTVPVPEGEDLEVYPENFK